MVKECLWKSKNGSHIKSWPQRAQSSKVTLDSRSLPALQQQESLTSVIEVTCYMSTSSCPSANWWLFFFMLRALRENLIGPVLLPGQTVTPWPAYGLCTVGSGAWATANHLWTEDVGLRVLNMASWACPCGRKCGQGRSPQKRLWVGWHSADLSRILSCKRLMCYPNHTIVYQDEMILYWQRQRCNLERHLQNHMHTSLQLACLKHETNFIISLWSVLSKNVYSFAW